MSDPLGHSLEPSQAIDGNTSVAPVVKRRGCLFWGCLTTLFVVVVGITSAGFLVYGFLTGQVREYTAEAAVELPAVEYSDADMEQLQRRLQQAAKDTPTLAESPSVAGAEEGDDAKQEAQVESESPARADDLVLTARDINALVSRNPQLRGRVFITIEDGEIGGEVSVPMESLPGGEGRFFNASATFRVELVDDELFVTVTDAYVKDKQAPKLLRDALARENLAKEINKSPQFQERLKKFESLAIDDDKIVLRVRTNPMIEQVPDEQIEPSDEPPVEPRGE